MHLFLNTSVTTLAILFFMNPFCSAGALERFSIEKSMFSIEDSVAIETFKTESLFGNTNADEKRSNPKSEADFVNYETLHKYLGYTTVLLAGLTAVTSSSKDLHYGAAYGTVGAALGTLTTGYIAYSDRFNMEDEFFTEDNNHILLGTLGAIGCIAAVALADSEGGGGHAGAGVFGGSAMALSIIVIKW